MNRAPALGRSLEGPRRRARLRGERGFVQDEVVQRSDKPFGVWRRRSARLRDTDHA
jgi:hypothetical protein